MQDEGPSGCKPLSAGTRRSDGTALMLVIEKVKRYPDSLGVKSTHATGLLGQELNPRGNVRSRYRQTSFGRGRWNSNYGSGMRRY